MKTKLLFALVLISIVNILQATDFKRIPAGINQDGLTDSMLPKCANLIKECLNTNENLHTDCLFAVSNHPFCEGSSLGKLTYRRWQLSGEFSTYNNIKSINSNNCLAKFDETFINFINNDNFVNQQNLIKLTNSIELCTQQNSIDLVRP